MNFSVTKKKYLAIKRAEFALKQRLERIDYEEDLAAQVAELEVGFTVGELPEFVVIEEEERANEDRQDDQAA